MVYFTLEINGIDATTLAMFLRPICDGLEMTMSEKSQSEAVNNGHPLFSFGNNSDKKTDR